jgi:hypothetical protein
MYLEAELEIRAEPSLVPHLQTFFCFIFRDGRSVLYRVLIYIYIYIYCVMLRLSFLFLTLL